MKRRRYRQLFSNADLTSCQGGICVGMTNGPHQGGNASYPVAWNGTTGTRLESTMTVPGYPTGATTEEDLQDITYYIWTDIFFGDESLGRMNQLVPQLILGSALDGSTGPPYYEPKWGSVHTEWAFGAHYFFETWNPFKNKTDAHAAYGEIFPVHPGETLRTVFELSLPSNATSGTTHATAITSSPAWTLTMSVVGDPLRTSLLRVDQPYMGLGANWEHPSVSWLEPHFGNMCINACWELYGATDSTKLPSTGAEYQLNIDQPQKCNRKEETDKDGIADRTKGDSNNEVHQSYYNQHHDASDEPTKTVSSLKEPEDCYKFTTWEQDEGNGVCPSCSVFETHNRQRQTVVVRIEVVNDSVEDT